MKIMKIAFVLVLILVIAGCNTNTAGNTNTGDSNKKSDAAPDGSADKQAGGNAKTDGASELKSLLAGKANLEWQVSYDIKTKSEGQEFQSKMTQYFKGEQKMRSDIAAQGVESRTYLLGEEFTVCTQVQNDWNCYKTDVKRDEASDVENQVRSGTSDYSIASDGTKTVAGTSAKCYKLVHKDGKTTARYCYSGEGVPLYTFYESDQATVEMTATSYSKSVSESVFEIPSPAADSGSQNSQCASCNYLSGEMKEQCLQSCGAS